MTLLEYKEKTNLDVKTQPERTKYICFYQMKENGITLFSMPEINQWFIEFGYNQVNISRLKDSLVKGKSKSFVFYIAKLLLTFFFILSVCRLLRNTDYAHPAATLQEHLTTLHAIHGPGLLRLQCQ